MSKAKSANDLRCLPYHMQGQLWHTTVIGAPSVFEHTWKCYGCQMKLSHCAGTSRHFQARPVCASMCFVVSSVARASPNHIIVRSPNVSFGYCPTTSYARTRDTTYRTTFLLLCLYDRVPCPCRPCKQTCAAKRRRPAVCCMADPVPCSFPL